MIYFFNDSRILLAYSYKKLITNILTMLPKMPGSGCFAKNIGNDSITGKSLPFSLNDF